MENLANSFSVLELDADDSDVQPLPTSGMHLFTFPSPWLIIFVQFSCLVAGFWGYGFTVVVVMIWAFLGVPIEANLMKMS